MGNCVFYDENSKNLNEGIVIGFKESSEFATKPIAEVAKGLGVDKDLIKMAQWMSKRYFCNTSDCIRLMLQPGTKTKNVANRIKERTLNFVHLLKSKDEIQLDIDTKKVKGTIQVKVLEFLLNNDSSSTSDIEMFTSCTISQIRALEKKGYLQVSKEKVSRNPFVTHTEKKKSKIVLTDEQKSVISQIELEGNNQYLIYGVTGSRKN